MERVRGSRGTAVGGRGTVTQHSRRCERTPTTIRASVWEGNDGPVRSDAPVGSTAAGRSSIGMATGSPPGPAPGSTQR